MAVVEDPVGWRLEYYYHTAEIIQDHPVIGVGTGGFVHAYRARTEQAGLDVPPHPHNQYLFIMAQVGIVGLGLLLWLFVQQWRSAPFTRDATYGLLARGVVVRSHSSVFSNRGSTTILKNCFTACSLASCIPEPIHNWIQEHEHFSVYHRLQRGQKDLRYH